MGLEVDCLVGDTVGPFEGELLEVLVGAGDTVGLLVGLLVGFNVPVVDTKEEEPDKSVDELDDDTEEPDDDGELEPTLTPAGAKLG